MSSYHKNGSKYHTVMSEWKMQLIEPPVGKNYLVVIFSPEDFVPDPASPAGETGSGNVVKFYYKYQKDAPASVELWDSTLTRLDLEEAPNWNLYAEAEGLSTPTTLPRKQTQKLANSGGSDGSGQDGTGKVKKWKLNGSWVTSLRFDEKPKVKWPVPRWKTLRFPKK